MTIRAAAVVISRCTRLAARTHVLLMFGLRDLRKTSGFDYRGGPSTPDRSRPPEQGRYRDLVGARRRRILRAHARDPQASGSQVRRTKSRRLGIPTPMPDK